MLSSEGRTIHFSERDAQFSSVQVMIIELLIKWRVRTVENRRLSLTTSRQQEHYSLPKWQLSPASKLAASKLAEAL